MGRRKLDVKSPASRAYPGHLIQREDAFVGAARRVIPDARLVHRDRAMLGGVSMVVPKDRVQDLARLPGVKAGYNGELNHPDTFQSPQYIIVLDVARDYTVFVKLAAPHQDFDIEVTPPVLHLPARGDATLYITIGPGGMREGDFHHARIVLKDPAGVRVATLPVTAIVPS